MDKVREALAELVAATDPRGDTPVEGWKSAWRKAREALSAQPAEPVALIAAAVERVRNTIILECETHEMLRENIARRVADVGKPTFAQPAPSEPADWRPFGLTVEHALNRGDDARLLFDENSPLRDELRRLLAAAPHPAAKGGEQ